MTKRLPAAVAAELRRELELWEPVIDLLALSRELEIDVSFGKIPGGAEGLSFQFGGNQRIFINSDFPNRRRQRFTIAHELGHCLLGHPGACSSSDVHGKPFEPDELAANEFAASLLMPPRLFREDLKKLSPSMAAVDHLAERYLVSRTAAALNFVKYTRDSCAVVLIGPERSWVAKSEGAGGLWVNDKLPDFYSKEDLGEKRSLVPAANWIDDHPVAGVSEIVEEIEPAGQNSWLIFLSELPVADFDEQEVEERSAREDLQRRRNSFRRY